MQGLDWNDLRHLLAVGRNGSLTAAAAALRVDATTVGRRLRAAEAALGATLVERRPDGAIRLTEAGRVAAVEAEAAEAAVVRLTEAVAGGASASGTVRVSAVPLLIGRALLPASDALRRLHPKLKLEFVSETRSVSLIQREADIALRLARPSPAIGGTTLARRVAHLAYAAYAPAISPTGCEDRLPWVTYIAAAAPLPQAAWLARAAERDGAASASPNEAEGIVAAIQAGLGRSILPRAIADGIPGLRRIATPADLPPPPRREVWLLTHPDLRASPRILAATDWLKGIAEVWERAGLGLEPRPDPRPKMSVDIFSSPRPEDEA